MTNHIPQNIKFLLSVNKVSRNTLSEVCQVNPVTISHWTAGRQSPKIDQLMRISKYFKITLDDLVTTQLTRGYEPVLAASEPTIQYGNRVSLLEELTAQLLNNVKDLEKRISLIEHTS